MCKVHIVGLGAGDLQQMPIGTYRLLKKAKHLYLRTVRHPVVKELAEEGLTYRSFDDLYEQEETFSAVYTKITDELMRLAREKGEITYAVPGHPLVAERTVQQLLQYADEQADVDIQIIGGQSFLDPLWTRLRLDPNDGFVLLDGTSLETHHLHPELHTVITQVYDQMVASDIKLTLMHVYPDDYPVQVVTAVGTLGEEKVERIHLYELDRMIRRSDVTLVYLPPAEEDDVLNRRYDRARQIVRTLRGPDGCPWDRKQTHRSLRKYLREEIEEVLEAIEEGDPQHLQEELGDVLLQVFLHAQIAEDNDDFNMEDILQSMNEKMIRRHPHVFGDVQIDSVEELNELWRSIKAKESAQKKSSS